MHTLLHSRILEAATYTVAQTLIPLFWCSIGESRTLIGIYSVYWNNANRCRTKGGIPRYTTAFIESCSHLLTEHSRTIQRNFDWRLCKVRKMIKTGDCVFFDSSDSVTKTSMFGLRTCSQGTLSNVGVEATHHGY